jgi:general secretion pathway protein D
MPHRPATFALNLSLILALSLASAGGTTGPALHTAQLAPVTPAKPITAPVRLAPGSVKPLPGTATAFPVKTAGTPVKAALSVSNASLSSGLSKVVTLQAGSVLNLPTALQAIAHSSGLNLFLRDVPPLPLTQSLKGLTGRQALDLLLSVYSDVISGVLRGNTLIVGTKGIVAHLNGDEALEVLPVTVTPAQIDALTKAIPNLQVLPFGENTILSGTGVATGLGKNLLAKITTPDLPTTPVVLAIHADVPVAPLLPSEVTDALKAAWPSLSVAATPTRVLLAGPPDDVNAAKDLLSRLQSDAVTRAAQVAAEKAASDKATSDKAAADKAATEKPAAPAPVVQAVVPVHTTRINLNLEESLVARLAASMQDPVKTSLITDGLFTVTGTDDDIAAFTAAARDLEMRFATEPTVAYAIRGSLTDATAGLKRKMPGLQVLALPDSHQLLISASPNDQSQVVLLLKQVDKQTVVDTDSDVVTDIVRLSYAQASDVVTSLGSGTGAAPATGTAPAAATSAAAAVGAAPAGGTATAAPASTTAAAPTASAAGLTVTADTRTNAVILKGPRRLVEDAKRVLLSLDVTLPNIKIGLNVQQITNSDGSDLGVDWQAGFAGVSVGGGSQGLSVAYAPAAAGPTLKVNLAANSNKTTSKTLLDTSLSTQAGRTSTLLSGGQLLVPVTNTTSTGGSSSTQQSRETYNYGLDVKVTPRLAPDGTVELAVSLTLGEKPVNEQGGNISIAKRTVTTIVTVKPGQQVTLGGLVSTDENNGNSGIPFLSSIPIIGALFGHQNASQSHSVLLITLNAVPDLQAVVSPVRDNGAVTTMTSTDATPAPAVSTQAQAAVVSAAAASMAAQAAMSPTVVTPGAPIPVRPSGTSRITIPAHK